MTGSNHRRNQTTAHHRHTVKTVTKFKSDDSLSSMKRQSTDGNGQMVLQSKCDPKSSSGDKPKTEIFESSVVTEYMLWKSDSTAGPGLRNHGNTCFLNSTIQCLLHTPALAQVLLRQSNLALKGLNSKNTTNPQKAILQLYQSLVVDVWAPSSRARSLSPRNMVQNIRRVGKQFRPNRQEDAHEYLRQLLDCMHEEILKANNIKSSDGKVAETTLICRVFGGYMRNELKCLSCNYSSKTYNHFQDLSLEISGSINSVSGALKAFIKSEKLSCGNEWKCDGCKKKVQALKQMTINAAPNVLVLHLKRFSYGGSSGKMNKRIDFEIQLDLPCNGESSTSSLFSLIGIVVHHGGSIHSGHYVAFVKAPNGQWYEMDDEDVTPVTAQHVLRQQAYILFYSKKVSVRNTPEESMHGKTDITAAKMKTSQATTKSHPSDKNCSIKIDRNESGGLKCVETNVKLVQLKCKCDSVNLRAVNAHHSVKVNESKSVEVDAHNSVQTNSVNEHHSFKKKSFNEHNSISTKSNQHSASLTQTSKAVGLIPSTIPKERLIISKPPAFGQLMKAAVVTLEIDTDIAREVTTDTQSCEKKYRTLTSCNRSDVIQSLLLVKSSCSSSSAIIPEDVLASSSVQPVKSISASRKRKTNATLDVISIPVSVCVPISDPVQGPGLGSVSDSIPVAQIKRCPMSLPFRFIGSSRRLPMSRIRRIGLRSTDRRTLKLRRASQLQGLYTCLAKQYNKN